MAAVGGELKGAAVRRRLSLPAGLGNAPIILGVWLLLVIAAQLARPGFMNHGTFVAVTFGMTVIGMMAIGEAALIMSGGMVDLSIGANAAAAAVVVAKILQQGLPWEVAVIAGLAVGVVFGLVNGSLVVFAGINPIITTLAIQFAASGALNLVAGIERVPNQSLLHEVGRSQFLGTPALFWAMLVLLLLVELFLTRTRPGRHLVAIGGDWRAATMRGISRPKVRFGAFIFCGFCAAAGGALLAAQLDTVETSLGSNLPFQVVTAVLVGGVSLAGGRGAMLGLLASLALISTMGTALVWLGFSSTWETVLEGLVLAVAVSVDAVRTRRVR